MSDGEVLILGAIAGFTIFLGLPIGRLRNPSLALKAFLNAVAVGILLFLFWDVLAGAFETVETALTDANDHGASWWRFLGLAALFFAAIAVGLAQPRLLRPVALPTSTGRPGCGVDLGDDRRAGSRASPSRSVSRSSSRSGSASTTSRKAWPSASPPRRARSAWRCC